MQRLPGWVVREDGRREQMFTQRGFSTSMRSLLGQPPWLPLPSRVHGCSDEGGTPSEEASGRQEVTRCYARSPGEGPSPLRRP